MGRKGGRKVENGRGQSQVASIRYSDEWKGGGGTIDNDVAITL